MKIWFNDRFKLGDTSKVFNRILITISEKEGSFGCIFDGVQTRNVSFPEMSEKTIHGVGQKSIELDEFAKLYSGYDSETKKAFQTIMVSLSRSFRYHVQQMSTRKMSIPSLVQNNVYGYISNSRNQFQKIVEGKDLELPKKEEVTMKEDIWMDVDELPADTLNTIVNGLFESSSREFSLDGKTYRLEHYKDEKGEDNVCIKVKGKGFKKLEEKLEEVKIIPTKKMAFMVDANGLDNFNVNNLYEIHGKDGSFTCLTDNFGMKRFVNNNRFKVIEVEQELSI